MLHGSVACIVPRAPALNFHHENVTARLTTRASVLLDICQPIRHSCRVATARGLRLDATRFLKLEFLALRMTCERLAHERCDKAAARRPAL